MRAHSNFIENTALVLILLVLVSLRLLSSIWLWSAGALYLVGRILHAIGMDGMMWGRMAGAIITMLTQRCLAITARTGVYTLRTSRLRTELHETEEIGR